MGDSAAVASPMSPYFEALSFGGLVCLSLEKGTVVAAVINGTVITAITVS